MESEIFLLITEQDADFLWPDGWDEEEFRKKGFLISKKIDENDLTLWDQPADKSGIKTIPTSE